MLHDLRQLERGDRRDEVEAALNDGLLATPLVLGDRGIGRDARVGQSLGLCDLRLHHRVGDPREFVQLPLRSLSPLNVPVHHHWLLLLLLLVLIGADMLQIHLVLRLTIWTVEDTEAAIVVSATVMKSTLGHLLIRLDLLALKHAECHDLTSGLTARKSSHS